MFARSRAERAGANEHVRVLVLGGDGMLGHKVFQRLSPRFEARATFRTAHGPWEDIPFYRGGEETLGGVDATEMATVESAIRTSRPDAVVNCIGRVKQREDARDPVPAISVNALFPHRLAAVCARMGARLVHVSTDCVFSGRKGAYREDDVPDPEDLYGRTKLLGEVDKPGVLTIRTSLVGREFVGSLGLLEWFLGRRGATVEGYRRAFFSGLTTQAFADLLGEVLQSQPDLSGLYHVASEPINKYDLLREVKDALGMVVTIQAVDEPRLDRSLDGSRFREATGLVVPSWEAMVKDLAKDDTPYDDWRSRHGIA